MNLRNLIIVLGIVVAFAAGSIATAASGWKAFASGTDTGTYGAFAMASADVVGAHGLAVVASKDSDLDWTLICDGELKNAKANVPLELQVAAAKSCHVSGDANTDSGGSVTLRLLRR